MRIFLSDRYVIQLLQLISCLLWQGNSRQFKDYILLVNIDFIRIITIKVSDNLSVVAENHLIKLNSFKFRLEKTITIEETLRRSSLLRTLE